MTTNLTSPHRAICQWPGKQRYATEQAAQSAAGRRSAWHGLDFRPYLCACGWWHLTTKPQRETHSASQKETP